jgi:CheY-like chemotaxis protein
MSSMPNALISPSPTSDDIHGLRILLVEDDQDARELFELLLLANGAHVRSADCAAEALNALRREEFDLLVSDLRMPGQDGFELLRRLRQFDQRLPALALSGCTSAQDRQQAFEAGFDGHVGKPVSPSALRQAVATVCAEHPSSR